MEVPWVREPGLVLVLGWIWRLVKPAVLLWWQGWKTLSVNGLGGEVRPIRTCCETEEDRSLANERPARVGWVA
jgi:hypothetical protein